MEKIVSRDATPIAYHRRGVGPPLVLVHGTGAANPIAWTAVLPALEERFFVYALDRHGSFDAVVSQFGLMFFTDRQRALREMLRVLAPRGTLAVAVWDRLENSAAYRIEVELLERLAGEAAAEALRAPFALGETKELMALFEGAGVASVRIATRRGSARFPSIRSMVEADLRGWLPLMGVVLEEERIQRILQDAESALHRYVTAEGQVVFDSPGHIVSGTRR